MFHDFSFSFLPKVNEVVSLDDDNSMGICLCISFIVDFLIVYTSACIYLHVTFSSYKITKIGVVASNI